MVQYDSMMWSLKWCHFLEICNLYSDIAIYKVLLWNSLQSSDRKIQALIFPGNKPVDQNILGNCKACKHLNISVQKPV